MSDFQKGYEAALDDVQGAMKLAEVNTLGPSGYLSYNDPEKYIKELKKLYAKRFPPPPNVV